MVLCGLEAETRLGNDGEIGLSLAGLISPSILPAWEAEIRAEPEPEAIPDRSAWRAAVASWTIEGREWWGRLANANEALGLPWDQSEWLAFRSIASRPEGPPVDPYPKPVRPPLPWGALVAFDPPRIDAKPKPASQSRGRKPKPGSRQTAELPFGQDGGIEP